MLDAVGPEIWAASHDFRMGAIDFGGRMTVIRLAERELLLYSPIPIDDALASELDALGEVKHVLAPNALHHLFVGDALARYPNARVYAPEALKKKRADLTIHEVLDGTSPWTGISLVRVDGAPQVDEIVLFHESSKSLVLCDLVFNIQRARGWFSPLFFRLLGVWQRLRQSPLWRYALTKDRAAAERSLQPMWAWDFRRIVLCHGDIVEGTDSKARLADAMQWMCPPRNLVLMTPNA